MKKIMMLASAALCGLSAVAAVQVGTPVQAPASVMAAPMLSPQPPVAKAPPDTPATQKMIKLYPDMIKRISAFGKLCVQGGSCDVKVPVTLAPAQAGVARAGEDIFKAVCTNCHSEGLLGSPKFGDKSAWAPRIAKGKPTLYQHAIAGFNSMPARGGQADLADQEVKNAVDYMVSKSS